MQSVLITAFEPYEQWSENSSWLALVELTSELPSRPRVMTRRYPVNLSEVKKRLAEDLADDYDYVLHLGQAPASSSISLELFGLNVWRDPEAGELGELCLDGPAAYRSELPLGRLCEVLRQAKIPARVSTNAGCFVCNGTHYWSHHLIESMSLKTQAAFIHLPLDTTQVLADPEPSASMPCGTSAQAIRLIIEELTQS